VAWFVTFGRAGLGTDAVPWAPETLGAVAPYTLAALASTASGVFGLPVMAGYLLLALLAGLAITRRPPAQLVVFAVAVVIMFAVAALFRSYGTSVRAETSRYVLVGAYLIVLGVLAAGRRPRIPGRLALAIGVLAMIGGLVELASVLPDYRLGRWS
jgi:hypothetical protein